MEGNYVHEENLPKSHGGDRGRRGPTWRLLQASVLPCQTGAAAHAVQGCPLLCSLGGAIFASGPVAGGVPLSCLPPGKVEHLFVCRLAISVSGES